MRPPETSCRPLERTTAPRSPGSASESLSPGPASESLIVAAPTELAPQEPQANLAAWDDDVVDTPHARACEALKAVKIGQGRPEADTE